MATYIIETDLGPSYFIRLPELNELSAWSPRFDGDALRTIELSDEEFADYERDRAADAYWQDRFAPSRR